MPGSLRDATLPHILQSREGKTQAEVWGGINGNEDAEIISGSGHQSVPHLTATKVTLVQYPPCHGNGGGHDRGGSTTYQLQPPVLNKLPHQMGV